MPCLAAAVLVEKILRVQPDVKRIYLPVRAPDAESAKKRVETEVSSITSSNSSFFCSTRVVLVVVVLKKKLGSFP